jgi:1-acyl-sn-glycerol-3-phosphate acyltransferase
MTSDGLAIAVLCCYAGCAVVAIAWQAWRCPAGPMIWWLYVAERLACGLLWKVRARFRDGSTGRCPFPVDSAALIVGNHRSPVDPIVLWQNHHLTSAHRTIRPIGFMMAREYYEQPSLNWFFKAMQAIPVTRGSQDTAAVRQAIQRLKAGEMVGIFPEGGINEGPPGIKAANSGVAFLALSGNAPVYPVYIEGAPTADSMVRAFFTPARVRLIYGEPIFLTAYRGQRKTQELLQEVTDVIMNAVAELGGVPYAGTVIERGPTIAPRHDPLSRPSQNDRDRRVPMEKSRCQTPT